MRNKTSSRRFFRKLVLTFAFAAACHPSGSFDQTADNAIAKAERYLRSEHDLRPDELAMLSYLDRKFGLPWVKEKLTPETIAALKAGRWAPFMRLIERGYRPPPAAIAQRPFSIDKFTLIALYCDAYGLPGDYQDRLFDGLRGDVYWPTHAVLSAVWAHENGCVDKPTWERWQPALYEALQRTLAAHPAVDDFFVESIALSYYAGVTGVAGKEALAQIIDAQRFTGGWPVDRRTPFSNNHTTILAFWSLLEARHPGHAQVNWAQ